MLAIDGSMGEGGGQILRSALALAMVMDQPFHLKRIRAGRDKPGLRRQHLTAVLAAAKVCGAQLGGAHLGSQELWFTPQKVEPGEYTFAIGTAGSTTLVLQTILPPLLVARQSSTLLLEGGTHNPHAPPADFLERAFVPLVNRMGPRLTLALDRYGFYPAGGGRLKVDIRPADRLEPIDLVERGRIRGQRAVATVARLPRSIAERELAVVREQLGWPQESLEVREVPDEQGPGNVLSLFVESEQVTEVFTGFGRRGVRAEVVAAGAAEEAQQYLAAGVPVGSYLADQLLLPLALAGGGSFVTLPLSLHSLTNMQLIGMFLEVRFSARQSGEQQWLVEVER